MTARRDGGWTQPPLTDGPVHRLLADTQKPCGFFRADEVCRPRLDPELPAERLDILRQEAAVASRGDGGGLEQPPRHSTKNGRPANAQAGG